MAQSSGDGQGKLGGLYLLSLLMVPSFIHMTAASNLPKILNPEDKTITTREGDSCTIRCTAETLWPRFHLVYWLVDEKFIEDAYPDGRVKEQPKSLQKHKKHKRLCYVNKTLAFTSTKPEDFTSKFTCVIQDPSGVDTKHFILRPEVGNGTATGSTNMTVTGEPQH